MILKASQRGGAMQLARHLLNDQNNDHVTVHSVTGFVAEDVTGALMEIYAVSRATKCTQFMFSLSLSPPKGVVVTTADFENAVDQAAERLGLQDQPRVILFHEKESRLHCHAVFSRIDIEAMRAINLPFFKSRLTELSRELYLAYGWELPKGLSDPSLADPRNFGLVEWQEARRAKRDPREMKLTLKQCFTQSDGQPAFTAALKERGFWLCRGGSAWLRRSRLSGECLFVKPLARREAERANGTARRSNPMRNGRDHQGEDCRVNQRSG